MQTFPTRRVLAPARILTPPPQVADIPLADFGRKEINLAEVEMPGLMATRAKYVTPPVLKKRL